MLKKKEIQNNIITFIKMPKTKSTEGQYTISDLPQGSHSKPELRSAVFETEFFLTKCHCIVY